MAWQSSLLAQMWKQYTSGLSERGGPNLLRRAALQGLFVAGLAYLAISLGSTPAVAQVSSRQDILVIAHPGVASRRLDRDTLRALFAMRQRTWPDGNAAQVFVLPNDSSTHATFAKEWLSVYPHQLQLAWDRMVFSGTGQAPHRVRTQRQMVAAVSSTPGAIGYINREYLDESVQVINVE
ncbi:hypothetical protein [Halomonas binhaiensis]|uniref:hypothetical protein n=1 Tax=Halomonas binhaiensis TaxID=2562282 RepID=UPI001F078579|nr:hypothetical protein [Halomonas binhaiensis]